MSAVVPVRVFTWACRIVSFSVIAVSRVVIDVCTEVNDVLMLVDEIVTVALVISSDCSLIEVLK